MNKTIRTFGLALVTLLSLLWTTQFTINGAVDEVIVSDAERRAQNWADYFVSNTPEIDALLQTGVPNEMQLAQIEKLAKVGDVFRFKLFDANGDLVLISDEVAKNLESGATWDHSGKAAEVIETGVANIATYDGREKPNRPDIYVEAYVPTHDATGKVIGVVEVYLNQTPVANLISSSFQWVAAMLAIVLTVAFGAPYIAFILKTRQETLMRNRAAYLAKFDLATGLHNRASFSKELDRLASRNGHALRRAGVGFVDVDNFKMVNDTYGHKAGDAYLKRLANIILNEVGPEGLVGRFGGDEIVFVTSEVSENDIRTLIENIRIKSSKPFRVDGRSVQASVSIGVHFGDEANDMSFDERMQKADVALYQSKLDGRDIATFYSAVLETKIEERRYIESAITNAIEEERMHVHFQPLLRSEDEKVDGFEALLRLRDRDGTNIPPTEFIPVAEEMGAIKSIGTWVLEQAATAASSWPEGVFVSVNLSSRQFDDGELVEDIRRILKKTGVDPRRLELEITESLLMENTESVSQQLAEIGKMGISLAMDDFGTGYSSLAYLWQFGFNKIKIDKSFVSGLDSDPKKCVRYLIPSSCLAIAST